MAMPSVSRLRKIETHSGEISSRRFLTNFYSKGKPLVLCGLAHNWPALRKWSPAFFAHTYGDVVIEIMHQRECDPLYELRKKRHRIEMKMRDFMAIVEDSGDSNDFYMVAKNRVMQLPEFSALSGDLHGWKGVLDLTCIRRGANLWIGPKGTITPLHFDNKNLLVVQIFGRKLFLLIPPRETPHLYPLTGAQMHSPVNPETPDLQTHPAFDDTEVCSIELNAGDALFLPTGWWHYVRAQSRSITVSFTCFAFPNPFPTSESQADARA